MKGEGGNLKNTPGAQKQTKGNGTHKGEEKIPWVKKQIGQKKSKQQTKSPRDSYPKKWRKVRGHPSVKKRKGKTKQREKGLAAKTCFKKKVQESFSIKNGLKTSRRKLESKNCTKRQKALKVAKPLHLETIRGLHSLACTRTVGRTGLGSVRSSLGNDGGVGLSMERVR